MEVEALNSGKLLEQLVSAGQEACAGEVLAIIGESLGISRPLRKRLSVPGWSSSFGK